MNLKPDFALWAKMPEWERNEAAPLLCGLDPDYAAKKWMFSRDLAAKYDSLLKLASRAHVDGRYRRSYPPAQWLAWAKKYDLPMPPELEAEIVKYDRAAVSAERESIKNPEVADEKIDTMIRDVDVECGRRAGLKLLWKNAQSRKLNCTKERLKGRAELLRPDKKSSVGRPKKIAPKN